MVVMPVAPTPSFRHSREEPKDIRTYPVAHEDSVCDVRFLDFFYWAGLPMLPGLPATSFLPDLDEEGLLLSAQAVGPWREDRTPKKPAESTVSNAN